MAELIGLGDNQGVRRVQTVHAFGEATKPGNGAAAENRFSDDPAHSTWKPAATIS